MPRTRQLLSLTAAITTLLLLGAGCSTTMPAIPDLPTTPPSPAMMDESPSDEAMMEGEEGDAAMMEKDEGMMDDEKAADGDQAMMKKEAPASYIAYSEGEFANARAAGRPMALYFWAGWCPICRAEEPSIKATIEASGLPVSGFRVNFDTESVLKKQFNIPYQHTMVILNRAGQESQRFTGPVSAEVLTAALAKAAE